MYLLLLLLVHVLALNQTDGNSSTFLSFEEWKKQKRVHEHAPDMSQIALQSKNNIGDELELDLEFFSAPEPLGKPYKRFNYASFDCAATIVKTNVDAKSSTSILFENKDTYLLSPCSSDQFVIIELCQDILVDDVVIGNFEFFSSVFKDIRVSVSDRYPATAWKKLGDFSADNVRNLQTFHVTNPQIWARFLKIEVLSHYGNEFYCPLSVVRVHGKTMMEEYKEPIPEPSDKDIREVVSQVNLTLTPPKNSGPIELKFDDFLKVFNEKCPGSNLTNPVPSAPAEESIFKNIMKRLSQLEANATLSVLYIEEQSKLLSRSFATLELNQQQHLQKVVSAFNATVLSYVDSLQHSYLGFRDRMAVIVESQAETNTLNMNNMQLKIDLLERELKFQKRLWIIMTIAFVCLLVYTLLTREAYIEAEGEPWMFEGSWSRSPSECGSPLPEDKNFEHDDEYDEDDINDDINDEQDLKDLNSLGENIKGGYTLKGKSQTPNKVVFRYTPVKTPKPGRRHSAWDSVTPSNSGTKKNFVTPLKNKTNTHLPLNSRHREDSPHDLHNLPHQVLQ